MNAPTSPTSFGIPEPAIADAKAAPAPKPSFDEQLAQLDAILKASPGYGKGPPMPAPLRNTAAIRTLFDTSHKFDAQQCGYEHPANPDHDGEGWRAVFIGTGRLPELHLTGPEGVLEFKGWAEISALTDACMDAERMARLMEGRT